MPTYEYACTACANQWEEIQKISADPLDTCPKCGQKTAKRQISGGAFILKGGGWYADLYSSSSNKKSDAPAKSEAQQDNRTLREVNGQVAQRLDSSIAELDRLLGS